MSANSKRDKNPASPARGDVSSPAPPPYRILVVEDELLVAWHLEAALRDLKYEVCGLVADGETAIEKTEQLGPDLVLMDINLAGQIDGIEAARKIKENHDAAIIFVTAYGDAAMLGRIERDVPGAPVLTKPVEPERLRRAITGVLEPR